MEQQSLGNGAGGALLKGLEQVQQYLHVVYWVLLQLFGLQQQLQHQHVLIILRQRSVRMISLVLPLKERNATPGLTQLTVMVALTLTITFTKCSKLPGPANGNTVGAK